MIRRPPRSTRVRSSAASDVYKRQLLKFSLRCSFDYLIVTRWCYLKLPPFHVGYQDFPINVLSLQLKYYSVFLWLQDQLNYFSFLLTLLEYFYDSALSFEY